MKKMITICLMAITVLFLSGCTVQNKELKALGLDGLTGKEILTGIADGSIPIEGFGLSVYDYELLVITETSRISVDMPKDEFYVSVAPYITQTHECLYHNATGCRGELKSETFYVEFVDTNNKTILSQEMDSLSNGFIDLWLPRDIEGTLTITYGDLTTSKVISTATGQPTCETTMQLQ